MAPTGHRTGHRPGPKTALKRRSRKAAASLAALTRWTGASSPPSASSVSSLPTEKKFTGSRIMNIEKLSADIAKVSEHSSICKGVCHVVEEVKREGLASVFLIECA